jgi:hypothetical protein
VRSLWELTGLVMISGECVGGGVPPHLATSGGLSAIAAPFSSIARIARSAKYYNSPAKLVVGQFKYSQPRFSIPPVA